MSNNLDGATQIHCARERDGKIHVTVWKSIAGLNPESTTTKFETWSDALRELAARSR